MYLATAIGTNYYITRLDTINVTMDWTWVYPCSAASTNSFVEFAENVNANNDNLLVFSIKSTSHLFGVMYISND